VQPFLYIIGGLTVAYLLLSLVFTYLVQEHPRKPFHDLPGWGRTTDTMIATAENGRLEVWRVEPNGPSRGIVVLAHGWGRNRDRMVQRARHFGHAGAVVGAAPGLLDLGAELRGDVGLREDLHPLQLRQLARGRLAERAAERGGRVPLRREVEGDDLRRLRLRGLLGGDRREPCGGDDGDADAKGAVHFFSSGATAQRNPTFVSLNPGSIE